MKNTLKRTFAAIGATALTASMASMTAFAASTPMANYCDKQDNAEAKYDGSYWVQPTAWGSTKIDPSSYSANGPEVKIDKIEVDASVAPNSIQTVNISYDGPEKVVSTIAFHILWDTRMEVQEYRGNQVSDAQDALNGFSTQVTKIEPGLVSVASSAGGNELYAGKIYKMQFKLPADAKGGDIYPIGIRYQYDGKTGDLFYDENQSANGKLHMAYVFTQGIENGYIKVTGGTTTTTTTTTPTTTTTTTTSTSTTTTTTAPVDTTTTTTAPVDTTTTTAGNGTTTTTKKAAAATTTTKKKAAATTTTPKSNSPKTGVAGVGVAAAGLAIAVGTAFALRKKED
ncbi:MAG: NPXTG-anchored protein [Ruminococcus sp.]|nr:NPXTG-anchored protein [Ruminococcus sp.]